MKISEKLTVFFCLASIVALSFANMQCTKASAGNPHTLSAIACADTSGVYNPAVISSANAGTVFFNPAHFIRVCNEVYVSGSLSATNAFDTASASLLQVSLPFPSTLTGQSISGQALIGFNGNPQPTMGNIGFVHLVGATGAVISWQPQKKSVYGLIYSFTYTIQ